MIGPEKKRIFGGMELSYLDTLGTFEAIGWATHLHSSETAQTTQHKSNTHSRRYRR